MLIAGIAFTLLTAWMVVSRIRPRFQTYAQAADRVARQLGDNTTAGQTWVEIWDCHPLTIPMIKELASSMDFEFVEEGLSSRSAAKTLVFAPPPPKPRRLEL